MTRTQPGDGATTQFVPAESATETNAEPVVRHGGSSPRAPRATSASAAPILGTHALTTGRDMLRVRRPGATTTPDGVAALALLDDAPIAENTRRGYKSDWVAFTDWCLPRGDPALPAHPLTVVAHLTWMANMLDEHGDPFYAPGTISRRLAAINAVHSAAVLPRPGDDPDVAAANAGIKRLLARPLARKTPLLLEDLQLIVENIDQNSWPAGVIGHRDVAMLTMGMVGAFRRSELVSLRIMDLHRDPSEGLTITLGKQLRNGRNAEYTKVLPFGTTHPSVCAPCSFARWVRVLAAAADHRADVMRVVREGRPDHHICLEPLLQITALLPTSPVFRAVTKHGTIGDAPLSGQTVNDVVQRRIAAVGVDSSGFGAHSLRAGFITQAFRNGANHHEVACQSGHSDHNHIERYAQDDRQARSDVDERMNPDRPIARPDQFV